MSSRRPTSPASGTAIPILGIVAVALAPGMAVGVAIAELLRRCRLRWTWTLPPLLSSAAVAILVGPAVLTRYINALAAVADGAPTQQLLAAGGPAWLLTVAPTAAAFNLWRDRRDRLHGGAREQALRDVEGPLDVLARHRARKRADASDPYTSDGILLGETTTGHPLRIPPLAAHATILGGSNSGKTNTAQVLLEGHVAAGAGFVVLDGKGGRELPKAAVALAERHNRNVAIWSVAPFNDLELDRHRLPWNPVGDATPTEAKDLIASSEEQTEPYYRAVASRGLLAAAECLHKESKPLTIGELAKSLENAPTLAKACNKNPNLQPEAAWLKALTDGERSALRGMATRLRTMVASDGGTVLTHDEAEPHINLRESILRGDLVVFTLPQGAYPELVPHVARYALQSINAVCTKIEQTGERADALVFVDELSAFDGDQLCATFERGRSAGVRCIVATQSLSNFESAGDEKLLHAAIDNAEQIVIHRQAVPHAAELLAATGGTEETWEHTHLVSDAAGWHIGLDEPGTRNRRLTDRFRTHPNVIKQLPQGAAILVSQRPRFAVQRVSIRAF